jgi:MFS family permease
MLRDSAELRVLSAMTLVNTVGNGLMLTSVVLYFTRHVGLSGGQVGLGLTVAGGCGLLVGVPAGHLGDRRGPREVLAVLMAGQGLAVVAYVFVSSFAAFVVAACVVIGIGQAGSAVKQALIAQVLPATARVEARAFLRAVTNAGFAVGSAAAGIGILVDTRGAYEALILADAVTFLLAALLLLRLPHVPPQPRRADGPQLIVLRDRPYVAVTALVAVMSLHASLLDVGLPLWIAHTAAPASIVPVVFVVNCLLVVLLSVRFARGSETVGGAARAAVRAALLLAASCVVFALGTGVGAVAASAILIVAAVIQVGGEMAQAASGWGLAYGLAPEDAQGQYQGLSSTALSLATTVGPLLMAAVVAAGTAGWLAYGAVFLVAGFATVPVAAWAERQRPTPGAEAGRRGANVGVGQSAG